jgi:hypothetical protein
MTSSGQYLTDILDIVPDYAIWKIEAYNDAMDSLVSLFDGLESRIENSDLVIELTKDKKEKIKGLIISNQIDQCITHMWFWVGDKRIFEGYDHLAYGSIAPEFSLKNNFKTKYIDNDLCSILKD